MVAYEDYLQTSAPVNPGNSGGPLISTETGEVIGVINSKIEPADGMGFAVPINIFRYGENEVLQGTVRHSWIGIHFPFEEDFNDAGEFEALRSINALTGFNRIKTLQEIHKETFDDGGILITDVMQKDVPYFNTKLKCADDSLMGEEGSLVPPAKKADLRIGDIIKSVNGERITNSRELIYSILTSKPCVATIFHIIRFDEQGERTELDAKLIPILRNPKGVEAGFY